MLVVCGVACLVAEVSVAMKTVVIAEAEDLELGDNAFPGLTQDQQKWLADHGGEIDYIPDNDHKVSHSFYYTPLTFAWLGIF